MDHLPWLLERGTEAGGNDPCGHALMASCPPEPFPELTPDIPFGYSNVGAGPSDVDAQRTWELSKGDLATLLDLSKRLNLDGEITPVMAWGMVLAHPRLGELKAEDLTKLSEELGGKVRCYGYVVHLPCLLYFFSKIRLAVASWTGPGVFEDCAKMLTSLQIWRGHGGVRGSGCPGEHPFHEIRVCHGLLIFEMKQGYMCILSFRGLGCLTPAFLTFSLYRRLYD